MPSLHDCHFGTCESPKTPHAPKSSPGMWTLIPAPSSILAHPGSAPLARFNTLLQVYRIRSRASITGCSKPRTILDSFIVAWQNVDFARRLFPTSKTSLSSSQSQNSISTTNNDIMMRTATLLGAVDFAAYFLNWTSHSLRIISCCAGDCVMQRRTRLFL